MKSHEFVQELIALKEQMLAEEGYIVFSAAELKKFDTMTARNFTDHFRGRAMMRLPEEEILFFDWLKKNDKAVWDDLWKDEDDPYRISIAFLHHFLKHGNGFPICDLIDEDNYWFCARHIKPKGMELMQDIGDKVKKDEPLSFAEAFLLEVFRGSTDLWHFCYRYNVPVKTGKSKIDEMNHDDLLVHLPERDDLVKYLDI